MRSGRQVLFLSAFHSFISRNIIDSGVLALLAAKMEVVVFVPLQKLEYYRTNYTFSGVEYVGIDVDTITKSPLDIFFAKLSNLLLDTRAKRFHKMEHVLRDGNYLKYYLEVAFTAVFTRIPFFRRLTRFLDGFQNSAAFERYFDEYKPTLVFVTDVFNDADTALLKNAKRRHVPTIAMVRSWDNLSNKTLLRVLPDTFILQNETMREEAIRYHLVPADRIAYSGIPQFEFYKKYIPMPREQFCKSFGFDPSRRMVLFSPAGNKFIDTDWEICEILQKMQEAGQIPADLWFLVRVHPHNPSSFDKFTPSPNFFIERPGVAFEGRKPKDVELSGSQAAHLGDSLVHSAMVINVVSSIMIDAAVLDKPVITIGFDGWETQLPFVRTVRRLHEDEGFKVLLDSGASPIARSVEELEKYINAYLQDPKRDSEKRAEFLQNHFKHFDGNSVEHLAEIILSKVE